MENLLGLEDGLLSVKFLDFSWPTEPKGVAEWLEIGLSTTTVDVGLLSVTVGALLVNETADFVAATLLETALAAWAASTSDNYYIVSGN